MVLYHFPELDFTTNSPSEAKYITNREKTYFKVIKNGKNLSYFLKEKFKRIILTLTSFYRQ